MRGLQTKKIKRDETRKDKRKRRTRWTRVGRTRREVERERNGKSRVGRGTTRDVAGGARRRRRGAVSCIECKNERTREEIAGNRDEGSLT